VIGEHQRNVAVQLTGFVPVEQVGKTVVVLRNQNAHARRALAFGQPPVHLKAGGNRKKLIGQFVQTYVQAEGSNSTRIRNKLVSASRCSSACRILPLWRKTNSEIAATRPLRSGQLINNTAEGLPEILGKAHSSIQICRDDRSVTLPAVSAGMQPGTGWRCACAGRLRERIARVGDASKRQAASL